MGRPRGGVTAHKKPKSGAEKKSLKRRARTCLTKLHGQGKIGREFHIRDLRRVDPRFKDEGEFFHAIELLIHHGTLTSLGGHRYRLSNESASERGLAEARALQARKEREALTESSLPKGVTIPSRAIRLSTKKQQDKTEPVVAKDISETTPPPPVEAKKEEEMTKKKKTAKKKPAPRKTREDRLKDLIASMTDPTVFFDHKDPKIQKALESSSNSGAYQWCNIAVRQGFLLKGDTSGIYRIADKYLSKSEKASKASTKKATKPKAKPKKAPELPIPEPVAETKPPQSADETQIPSSHYFQNDIDTLDAEEQRIRDEMNARLSSIKEKRQKVLERDNACSEIMDLFSAFHLRLSSVDDETRKAFLNLIDINELHAVGLSRRK